MNCVLSYCMRRNDLDINLLNSCQQSIIQGDGSLELMQNVIKKIKCLNMLKILKDGKNSENYLLDLMHI